MSSASQTSPTSTAWRLVLLVLFVAAPGIWLARQNHFAFLDELTAARDTERRHDEVVTALNRTIINRTSDLLAVLATRPEIASATPEADTILHEMTSRVPGHCAFFLLDTSGRVVTGLESGPERSHISASGEVWFATAMRSETSAHGGPGSYTFGGATGTIVALAIRDSVGMVRFVLAGAIDPSEFEKAAELAREIIPTVDRHVLENSKSRAHAITTFVAIFIMLGLGGAFLIARVNPVPASSNAPVSAPVPEDVNTQAKPIDTARRPGKRKTAESAESRSARKLVESLQAPDIAEIGLAAAIRRFAEGIEAAYPDRCKAEEISAQDPDRESAIHIFRILQEAVALMIGASSTGGIVITFVDDAGAKLCILGTGLDDKALGGPSSPSWISMQYRARLIGATLDQSSSTAGLLIACRLSSRH